MPRLSAGIIVYRRKDGNLELFLVHPGGPFWAKKDAASWSIPKGEYSQEEDSFVAARREFHEETGFEAPQDGALPLGEVRYGNKVLTAWALEGSVDARRIQSNTFTMEWPPKSGKTQEFPEVDRAGWFLPSAAKQKLVKGQVQLVDRLCEQLGVSAESSDSGAQMSLL